MGGCLVSAAVGFIGALLGKWMAAEMGLTFLIPVNIDGETFPIVWSILGAALFSVVIGLFNKSRR